MVCTMYLGAKFLGGPNRPEEIFEEGAGRKAPRRVGAPENFPKINVKIAYFSAFLRAEMVSSVVASRQD